MYELLTYFALIGMFSCFIFSEEIKQWIMRMTLKWGQRLATSKIAFEVVSKMTSQINKPADTEGLGVLVDMGHCWMTTVCYGTLKFPIYIPKDTSQCKQSRLVKEVSILQGDDKYEFYPAGFPIFWDAATVKSNIEIIEGEGDVIIRRLD